VQRLAYTTLFVLALTFGLGDAAGRGPLTSLLQYAIHGLVPIAIVLALLASLRRRQWPSFPRALAVPIAIWFGILVLSAATAPVDRLQAIATLERPASGALLVWVLYSVASDARSWQRLAGAVGVGGLLVAAVGLAQASGQAEVQAWLAELHDGSVPIGDVPRLSGTLSHPNMAAMTFELSLPLLVAWAWTARGRWRIAAAGASVVTLLALVLTFSRAGIACGIAAIGVMLAAGLARGERRQVVAVAMAAIVVPLVLLWTWVADPGLDRRLTAGLNESSASQPSRLIFWAVAFEMAWQNPWLGVGPDNYRLQFADYTGRGDANEGIHAHDQYLEALADTGLLGLLGLGWLLVKLMRTAASGARSADGWPWRLAVLASLSAWLLHAVVDDFERFWATSVAFWLIAGLAVARSGSQSVERAEQRVGRITFGDERGETRAQRFIPLFGATTQNDHLAGGMDVAQAVERTAVVESG
jgi:O-antigen ligase